MKLKRRVLITGDTTGGVWTFSTGLAKSLLGDGMQVMLATFGPSVSDVQRQQAASIQGLDWRHLLAKLEWMDEPWSDVRRSSLWLSRIISDFSPDVLHLNTFCHCLEQPGIPVVLTAHSCVPAWWSAVKTSPLPAIWSRYQTYVQQAFDCAALVTAPTMAALRDTSRYFDFDLTHALTIYNGSDPKLFRPAQKEPLVLSAGRLWDEAKNSRALANVSSEVLWPIYLAGNIAGPSESIAGLHRCHLLGELSSSQLYRWYSRAGIYALPAKYEPFGLSALEAGLSGCALVLGNIQSMHEVWNDAAVFVDPEDLIGLRNALNQLIGQPDYRSEMSSRALKRAQTFTPLRMVDGYHQAYSLADHLNCQAGRRHECAS